MHLYKLGFTYNLQLKDIKNYKSLLMMIKTYSHGTLIQGARSALCDVTRKATIVTTV